MALTDIVFDPTETGLFELPITGANYTITGRVLDGASAPISGAVVKAFRTGNDRFVAQTTSNSTGYYVINTGYFENHYVVAYLDAVTDKAGVSINTIMPTP